MDTAKLDKLASRADELKATAAAQPFASKEACEHHYAQACDRDGFQPQISHKCDQLGEGHAQPMLDSPVAWCPAKNNTEQQLTMDLGTVTLIGGIVVQGRCAGNSWKCDLDGHEYIKSCYNKYQVITG